MLILHDFNEETYFENYLCKHNKIWQLKYKRAAGAGAGAATFRVEPEPIFVLPGPESQSPLFKAASYTAVSYRQANKEKALLLCQTLLSAIYNGNYNPKDFY